MRSHKRRVEQVSLEAQYVSSWRQLIIGALQKLVVDRRIRGLSRLIWHGRRAMLGSGWRIVNYRDRFDVLCNSDSWYSVMRTFGYVHRAHDRLLRTLLGFIDDDPLVFVDAGANEGFVSLLACSVTLAKHAIQAHCFEPNPIAFQILVENSELNGFHIISRCCALGKHKGSAALTLGADSTDSTLIPGGLGYIPSTGSVPVPVMTLDAYCEENALVPSVIKIDTEGYEPYVLQGAVSTIKEFSPCLIVEVNQKALLAGGNSAEELLSMLTPLGYRLLHVDITRLGLPWHEATGRVAWKGYVEVCPGDVARAGLFDLLAIPEEKCKD